MYVAPLLALLGERASDWRSRLGSRLGLNVVELSGDSGGPPSWDALADADLVCTTAEKFDAATRRGASRGAVAFLSDGARGGR